MPTEPCACCACSQIDATKTNMTLGRCLKRAGAGDKKQAVRYMQRHLAQMERDKESEAAVRLVLHELAWELYHNLSYAQGLAAFLRLPHALNVRWGNEGAIAHCYEHCDADKAMEYYKLYQEKHAHNPWSWVKSPHK